MSKEDLKKIKEVAEGFLKKINEEFFINNIAFKNDTLFLNLEVSEPNLLIGEKGQTLFFLQHLLKKMLIKQLKLKEPFYLDLDINSYKEKKTNYLKEMVEEIANEVALTKEEKELIPMSPYERRIIHLEISKRNDVTSYSVGKEPNRRIIIKPI
jgi:spoIIIJ-associated protein